MSTIYEQFVALYERESDAVFRFCFLRTSNRETAIDLMQDTFLRIWQTCSKGVVIKHERAFLFTVARNLVISWYRKKKEVSLEALFEDGTAAIPETLADSTDFLDEIENTSKVRRIIESIASIHSSYQLPVYLRFVEDLPPRDIAVIMGESANVVSVKITRGLEALRTKLGKE